MPKTVARLPLYDLATDAGRAGYAERLERLRGTASLTGEAAQTVREVVESVRERGDAAVVECMRRWTDPAFEASRIRVTQDELASAEASVERDDPALLSAIDRAIENVLTYQRHVLPRDPEPVTIAGAELGLRWTPVDSAGLCVPGGTAPLFSTLLMLAGPALAAGVPADRIRVIHPPPTRPRNAGNGSRQNTGDSSGGDIAPVVLATAKRLGLTHVYRVGGAQGVAALAYGTETVEPVDLVVGPGNVYVQLAKAMVAGVCGTEGGFYGPSEVVVVADDTADPARVAADLLAQAEHDPGKCFLVSWRRGVVEAVTAELARQLPTLSRDDAIERSLDAASCAVLVEDEGQAADVVNELATEHLTLAVADPRAWLGRVRHAGEAFLGDATPVAAGDYFAGPSHCLPTGTTARFASGVSVYTFLKRTGTVAYPGGMPSDAIDAVARMAAAEGLDAHAASVEARSR